MSTTLSNDAPETDPAAGAEAPTPPGDGTAVAEGSAEQGKTVDAGRFNGLMSAHQKALDALNAEREARIALEARLQDKEQVPVTTDNQGSDEVALLRQELAEQRLATAKAAALAKYPDAAPFADLIVGSNASEVESVAAAIAQRMATVKEGLGVTTPAEAEAAAAEAATEAVTTPPAATEVPVIVGGTTPPGEPNKSEELQAALAEGSWDKFWAAKASPSGAATTLA